MKSPMKEKMDNYFLLLKEMLADSYLLDRPGHIYNMDESGTPLNHKQPKWIAPMGMRRVLGSLPATSLITFVACGNAAGLVLPPMV